VLKLLALVIALIGAAKIAAACVHFNPAIPIFIILGFGIYMVGRIGGPQLPQDTHVSFGDTHGVYLQILLQKSAMTRALRLARIS
jgi:hypothetical protein